MEIKKVEGKFLHKVIEERKPLGLFYHKAGKIFVGCDNRTGEAWVEEFKSRRACIAWLKGKSLDW
jgi:hypothetical protein